MVIFYLTIPLMLVAVGLALAPLLWAMKRQFESEAPVAATRGDQRASTLHLEAGIGPAADVAYPHDEIGNRAA